MSVIPVGSAVRLTGQIAVGLRSWAWRRKVKPEQPKGPDYDRLIAAQRNARADQRYRFKEVADTTTGTRVFFSRHVLGDSVEQLAILVGNMRYSLHRKRESGGYTFDCGASTLPQEQERTSSTAIIENDTDSYHMCLIGWTVKTPQIVEKVFEECQKELGVSSATYEQCGKFLSSFASKILNTSATDRQWFSENVQSIIKSSRRLPTPPKSFAPSRIQLSA